MTNVVPMPDKGRAVTIDFNDPVAVYLDSEIFGQLQRVAKLMSSASLAPVHLRGEGKLGDCFLVAAQAFRWRMDPFAVAQHTYVVQGKLGYEGKLIAAIVNASGRLDGSLSYSYSGAGDDRTIIVSGKLKSDGEIRVIDGDIKRWRTTNEQWKKQPDQMLAYRGAREWARRHMPEAVLGIHAEDDFAPTSVNMKDITPQGSAAASVDALLSQQDADQHHAPAVSDSPDLPSPAEPATGVSPTAGTTGAPADVTMTPVAWLDGVRAELAKAETLSDVAMLDAANVVKAAELGATTLRNYKTAVLQARTRIGGA